MGIKKTIAYQKASVEELKKLYYRDFPLWVEVNLELLKERAYDYVDWEHLLEEIEDMGQRHLDSGISHLARILEHLYKWDYLREAVARRENIPVEKVGYSWIKTVEIARIDIEALFEKYPSLKRKLPAELQGAWRDARRDILKWLIKEDFDPKEFVIPEECPYTYEEAMTRDLRKELRK